MLQFAGPWAGGSSLEPPFWFSKKILYATKLYFLNLLLFATGTLASLPLLSIQAAMHCFIFMKDHAAGEFTSCR